MRNKPKIINTDQNRRVGDYPLIEILGQIDIGKKHIAKVVSKRIGAKLISFPILTNSSPTGGVLLDFLINRPIILENNPVWWAHLYSANLLELSKYIQTEAKERPIVVLNYIYACRNWMKSMDLDMSQTFQGFSLGLKRPDSVFCILGNKYESLGNLKVDFSSNLIYKVDMAMKNLKDFNTRKIITNYHHERHVMINETAEYISGIIGKKYNLRVNNYKYKITDLPLIKDEL